MKRSRWRKKERGKERKREIRQIEKKKWARGRKKERDRGERSFIARPTNKRACAGTAWRTGRKKRPRESNESTFY